jgi:hypothetical protein
VVFFVFHFIIMTIIDRITFVFIIKNDN